MPKHQAADAPNACCSSRAGREVKALMVRRFRGEAEPADEERLHEIAAQIQAIQPLRNSGSTRPSLPIGAGDGGASSGSVRE
jgi:hypothetical protein